MLFALLFLQRGWKRGHQCERCTGSTIDKTGQITKWGLGGK